MRIIQEAEKHKVPVMEDKPLAQALYKAVDLNDYIPVEFYQAVAEILAWVYNSRGKGTRKI
jgi:flagellar biosynthesis protein FlhB